MAAIYVPDFGDVVVVATALQQAADTVLNPQVMARLKDGEQECQHIYPRRGPALGGVYLVFGGHGEDTASLFVELFMAGRHGGGVTYVPQSVARRLRVQLKGVGAPQPFKADRLNKQIGVHLHFSKAMFKRHPRALVTFA